MNLPLNRRWKWIITGTCAFWFFATRSLVISSSHDGITLLGDIATGQNLFHQHHLLFSALSWLIHHTLTLALTITPLTSVLLLNSVFGGLLMASVAQWLHTYTSLKKWHLIPALVLIGSSYGIWFHTHTVEVYIIPLYILFLIITQLCRASFTHSQAIWIGVLHGLAIGFHITNALMSIPIALALALHPNLSRSFKLKWIIKSTLITYTLVGVMYAMASRYYHQIHSINDALFWITEITHGQRYWNSLTDIKTMIKLAFSLGRTFIGGHFMFQESIAPWVTPFFQRNWLQDDLFLVRNLSLGGAVALITATAVWLSAFIYTGIRAYRSTPTPKWPYPIKILALSMVPYALFFVHWDTENVEFWLLQSLIIQLLVIYYLSKITQNSWKIIAVLGISLCLINTMGSVRFQRDPNNDLYVIQADIILNTSKDGDTVIYENTRQIAPYILSKKQLTLLLPTTVTPEMIPTLLSQAHLQDRHLILITTPTQNAKIEEIAVQIEAVLQKNPDLSATVKRILLPQ